MGEEKELVVGRVYDTVIGKRHIGSTLYIGTKSIGRGEYRDCITFRDSTIIELWRFGNHSFTGEKLKISYANREPLSEIEEKHLEQRLIKAGL